MVKTASVKKVWGVVHKGHDRTSLTVLFVRDIHVQYSACILIVISR